MITDTWVTAFDYVWPNEACGSETINQNLDLDLAAKNLIDFLMAFIKTTAILFMVYHGFWAYQWYHFVKLDQINKSDRGLIQQGETQGKTTKIWVENEKSKDIKKEEQKNDQFIGARKESGQGELEKKFKDFWMKRKG